MMRWCLSRVSSQVFAAQAAFTRCLTGKSAVPTSPVAKRVRETEPVKLDQGTVELLERLSLVDISNNEAVIRLQEAAQFASAIFAVDTTGVEPMVTPVEDIPLYLREDEPVECSAEDILKNAKKTVEGYFAAPPGNIPLDIKADYGLDNQCERDRVKEKS